MNSSQLRSQQDDLRSQKRRILAQISQIQVRAQDNHVTPYLGDLPSQLQDVDRKLRSLNSQLDLPFESNRVSSSSFLPTNNELSIPLASSLGLNLDPLSEGPPRNWADAYEVLKSSISNVTGSDLGSEARTRQPFAPRPDQRLLDAGTLIQGKWQNRTAAPERLVDDWPYRWSSNVGSPDFYRYVIGPNGIELAHPDEDIVVPTGSRNDPLTAQEQSRLEGLRQQIRSAARSNDIPAYDRAYATYHRLWRGPSVVNPDAGLPERPDDYAHMESPYPGVSMSTYLRYMNPNTDPFNPDDPEMYHMSFRHVGHGSPGEGPYHDPVEAWLRKNVSLTGINSQAFSAKVAELRKQGYDDNYVLAYIISVI